MALNTERERLSPQVAADIRAFMESDLKDDCKVSVLDRHIAVAFIDAELPPSKQRSLSIAILGRYLVAAGITLEKLLEKAGLQLELYGEDERMRQILTAISDAGGDLTRFNDRISYLMSDFWFYPEMIDQTPTKKFIAFRPRFYSSAEYSRLNFLSQELFPTYRKNVTMGISGFMVLPIEELVPITNLWRVPARWMFSVPDGASAFIPDEEADIALMYFMMLHPNEKLVFKALLDRSFREDTYPRPTAKEPEV